MTVHIIHNIGANNDLIHRKCSCRGQICDHVFIEVMSSFFDLLYLIILNFFVCIFMRIFYVFYRVVTTESLVAHAPLFVN